MEPKLRKLQNVLKAHNASGKLSRAQIEKLVSPFGFEVAGHGWWQDENGLSLVFTQDGFRCEVLNGEVLFQEG